MPPAGSALLITSRNKFVLPGLKEKDLDVLPLEDAKELLLEIAARIGGHAGSWRAVRLPAPGAPQCRLCPGREEEPECG